MERLTVYECENPKTNMLFSGARQGVPSGWKSVQWISGYQGYQPDIRGKINGYQEEIDQISIKHLTYFSRISKLSAGYT